MTIPSKPNELPSDEQLNSSTSQNVGSSSSTNPSVLATVQISGSSPTQNTSTNIHPPPSPSRPTLSETSLFLLSTSDSLHPLHHQSHPQHSDSQDTIQITPSSANIPTTPPAYTPSATLPPSYWSGERVGSRGNESDTESDFDDDEITLGGAEAGTHPNRPRREIDLAVYTQTRRTSTPTKPRRSRTQKWCRKHLYGLRRLHWYTLFFVNWDIVTSLLLLLSTLLLLIPSTFPISSSTSSPPFSPSSTSPDSPQPQQQQQPSPSIYLPLLIPAIFSITAVTAKKAYTACTPTSNPTRESPVPPTHYLKLYNFFYLVRCGMDVGAVVRYAWVWEWWGVSGIRVFVAVGNAGVGLFYRDLFPCDGGGDGGGGGGGTVKGDPLSSIYGGTGGGAVQWDDKGSGRSGFVECLPSGVVFPLFLCMLVIRFIVLLFLCYYTQRLTNRLLRRLERNLAQQARANDFGLRQIEMNVLSS